MMKIEVPHELYMKMLRASKKRLGDAAATFSDETLVYLHRQSSRRGGRIRPTGAARARLRDLMDAQARGAGHLLPAP
jgi:hypothetical protein